MNKVGCTQQTKPGFNRETAGGNNMLGGSREHPATAPSIETGDKNTEEKKADASVKKTKSPLYNVPERLQQKLTLHFKLHGSQELQLRVNTALQLVKLPELVGGDQLDLGDLVLQVNTSDVTDKKQLIQTCRKMAMENPWAYDVTVTVVRVLRSETIPPTSSQIPAAIDVQTGFSYLVGYMCLLPRGSLGLKIKSYNYKIYVTSTDNGFNCISMRTLLVGDAILAVEERPVANVKECSLLITTALERKGFVTVIVERPDNTLAAPLVRAALMAEKARELDPRMTDDVVALCQRENVRRKSTVNQPIAKPILRTRGKERDPGQIGFKVSSMEYPIDMDPINPVLLRRVPPRATGKKEEIAKANTPIGNTSSRATTSSKNVDDKCNSKSRNRKRKQPKKK